ncbi:MAG: phosphatidylglycerophosphate synthase [Granulosicoccus sp.]|jgi:phosphatidylglycerophosphate synthase
MLDKYIVPVTKKPLRVAATVLHKQGVKADAVTVIGFIFGLVCILLIAFDHPYIGLIFLLLNRIADGIDGELARLSSPSDAGGFLDITLDFIFYALFPLGFALADPAQNALPAAFLIASFVGTGASFLAFATFADKHAVVSPDFEYKGMYYLNGLAEGTETILCFALMCLFATYFAQIAWVFSAMCLITAMNRVFFGYRTLR